MTWSVSATGKNEVDTLENLREQLDQQAQCPQDMREAVAVALDDLCGGLAESQVVISAACSGHFDDAGKGYVTVTVATA